MASEVFAGRLRELRVAAGLSQKDLADKTGMAKDFISRLERAERSPSWETALALAAALGVEIGAFTIPPKDAPAPERGRPRKEPAPEGEPSPTVSRSSSPAAASKGRKAKGKPAANG
jgi:transcriptional regulator with XRE-family HTH domain